MDRRRFVALGTSAVIWPKIAEAQSASKALVGLLWPGAGRPPSPRMESLALALRGSGFTERGNLELDLRSSNKGLAALRDLATDLEQRDARVIATFGDLATRAAQEGAPRTPIVGITDDIIEAKLVSSLARPGGNTTGITLLSTDLIVKRFEFLKMLMPSMSRVAAFWDPLAGWSQQRAAETAAANLGLNLQVLEVRRADDLEGAFRSAVDGNADALNVFSSPVLAALYRPIVEHSARHKVPAIYQWKEHVDAGGLMSYGPSLAAMWRHVGVLIGKVLKGAKPADLPVEQPTKFELAINLSTAKQLGRSFPPEILIRADEIVE